MNYQEFKRLAVKARWYYKQMTENDEDYGEKLSNLFSELCQGDRNVSYSLLVAWTCWRQSEIYKWSVLELYDEIQKIAL